MPWLDTNPPGSKDPQQKLYVYFYDKNKKRTVRRVTKFYNKYPDKKAARKFLDKFNANHADTKHLENFSWFNDLMLSKAFEKFLRSRVTKPQTKKNYEFVVNSFIQLIGNKPINQYTRQDSIDYINKLKEAGKSANTVASYTKQLKVIWKWFVEEDIAVKNIIRTEPRKKVIVRTIPPEDLKKIFEYFRSKKNNAYTNVFKEHVNIIRFLYLTGFRPSTLAVLRTEDIRLNELTIYYHNEKENKQAVFPIHSALQELLLTMDLTPGRLVFPRLDKRLCFWKRAMKSKELQMDYTVKMLRKTLATEIAKKISVSAASFVMDHEDSEVTKDHYIAELIKDPVMVHRVSDKLRQDIDQKIEFVK